MNDAEFFEWLVPSRSKIQETLLKLYAICNANYKEGIKNERFDDLSIRLADVLVGMGFSLWRAVFLAGHEINLHSDLAKGLLILKRVIADNTIVYADDKNSWSFKFYLENVYLRHSDLYDIFDKEPNSQWIRDALEQITIRHHEAPNASPYYWNFMYDLFVLWLSVLEMRIKS